MCDIQKREGLRACPSPVPPFPSRPRPLGVAGPLLRAPPQGAPWHPQMGGFQEEVRVSLSYRDRGELQRVGVGGPLKSAGGEGTAGEGQPLPHCRARTGHTDASREPGCQEGSTSLGGGGAWCLVV